MNHDFSHKQLKMYSMRTTAAHIRAAWYAGMELKRDKHQQGYFYGDMLQHDLYHRTLLSLQTKGVFPTAI